MTKDMSKREFDAACERHGFQPTGFLGYYRVARGVEVSVLNAGRRRRDQLAYLIKQSESIEKKYGSPAAASSP